VLVAVIAVLVIAVGWYMVNKPAKLAKDNVTVGTVGGPARMTPAGDPGKPQAGFTKPGVD